MPFKDREKRLAYGRRFREENPDYMKRWIIENPEYYTNYSKRHPGYFAKCTARFRKNNLNYAKKCYEDSKICGGEQAKWSVKNAIKSGILKSLTKNYIKCSLCNSRAVHYDHRDYNFPLDVTPVCQPCNIKLGKAIPKSEAQCPVAQKMI